MQEISKNKLKYQYNLSRHIQILNEIMHRKNKFLLLNQKVSKSSPKLRNSNICIFILLTNDLVTNLIHESQNLNLFSKIYEISEKNVSKVIKFETLTIKLFIIFFFSIRKLLCKVSMKKEMCILKY